MAPAVSVAGHRRLRREHEAEVGGRGGRHAGKHSLDLRFEI